MESISKEAIADFDVVVENADALLNAATQQGSEKLSEVRAKAEESLRVVRASLAEAQAALMTKTKDAAKATDTYVHENTWKAVGIAASVGMVIGLLIGRR